MAGKWREFKLSDLTVYLYRGAAPSYVDSGGVLVLNQKCIRDHRVDVSQAKRTDVNKKPITKERILQVFDILVNSTGVGTLGRVAQINELPEIATVDSHITVLRPNPNVVDPRYLGLAVRCNESGIEALGEGSTGQTELSRFQLGMFRVPVPPLPEQRAIAHILGTLDDKIELNRRMSETLEAMARALFKSWFVDFDPVRAKAAGRPPALPKPLAALFPSRLVNSELGEIPEGWNVGCVDDEFDLTMGQSPPGETYNETGEGLPFYQGRADFGLRFPSRRVYCTAPTRFARGDDTLISVRAPVGDINMAAEDCAIGRGVAAARHRSGSRSYTYQFMSNLDTVFDQFEAEGTVFGSISKKDFHNISCVVPSRSTLEAFESMLEPIESRIRVIENESRTLAVLRDALLPKLISGELSLKYGIQSTKDCAL